MQSAPGHDKRRAQFGNMDGLFGLEAIDIVLYIPDELCPMAMQFALIARCLVHDTRDEGFNDRALEISLAHSRNRHYSVPQVRYLLGDLAAHKGPQRRRRLEPVIFVQNCGSCRAGSPAA